MHGSGTPPVVPAHQADIYLNQAAAVQNTWYTVLNTTKNCRLYTVWVRMATLAEDIELRITIDGKVLAVAQAAAVAGTKYFAIIDTNGNLALILSTSTFNVGVYAPLEGRSVKVEVRKTSANGANNLQALEIYSKW